MTLELDFEALYERWFGAVMAGDPGPFNEILADDWVYTDIFGAVWAKPGYLDLVRSLAGAGVTLKLTDHHVRPLGDVALVTGGYAVDGGLPGGKDLSSETRFTALWDGAGGRWRNLAHHATRRTEPD